MSNKSPLINVIQKSITKVSRRLIRDFGEIENLQLSHEKIDRFASNSYSFVSNTLKDELKSSRPEWAFFTKESEHLNKSKNDEKECSWIVEPINGFDNFIRGIPLFAISVSVKKDNKIIASSIFDPNRDEFFFAEKGKGAYLNDRRIRVSNRKGLKNCLISLENNFDNFLPKILYELQNTKAFKIRLLSCSALSFAWVSCGKLDCFLGNKIDSSISETGNLILRESGGFFSEFSSNSDFDLIVANPAVHKEIIKLINFNETSI